MSTQKVTPTKINYFNQKVEESPSKFKRLSFAILIILGIGSLAVASAGASGFFAGGLTHFGNTSCIIMLVIGITDGIPLLVLGILGGGVFFNEPMTIVDQVVTEKKTTDEEGASPPLTSPSMQTVYASPSTQLVERQTPSTPSTHYVVRGRRFDQKNFDKFLSILREKYKIDLEEIDQDPGPGNHVVVFDYWGRPGGELKDDPFQKGVKAQATLLFVIVGPDRDNGSKQIKCNFSFDKKRRNTIVSMVFLPNAASEKIGGVSRLEAALKTS